MVAVPLPASIFSRITPYDRFIYYRPHGKRAPRPDSSHYFGHGVLGVPFDDLDDSTHRFVPLIRCEPFANLVSLRDPSAGITKRSRSAPYRGNRRSEPLVKSHTNGFSPQQTSPLSAFPFCLARTNLSRVAITARRYQRRLTEYGGSLKSPRGQVTFRSRATARHLPVRRSARESARRPSGNPPKNWRPGPPARRLILVQQPHRSRRGNG